MVAPKEPYSAEQRIRRLELMLFSVILSLGDEENDEDLWFEFHRLFRMRSRGRDVTDSMHFEHLLERVFNRGSKSQPESVLRQLERVQNDVRKLKYNSQELQLETHSLLAIQTLGLPSEQVQSTRYIPVRTYIDETPQGAIQKITGAVSGLVLSFGFSIADEFPEISGSWFKKWFAKSKDALSQPEVAERLEKLERSIDLKAIDNPQAEVDEKQAGAMAKLIAALELVPNAAVQAGSVLVVKLTTPDGPVIQARTLTQEEMLELENNQLLLQTPSKVLENLANACGGSRVLPCVKMKFVQKG